MTPPSIQSIGRGRQRQIGLSLLRLAMLFGLFCWLLMQMLWQVDLSRQRDDALDEPPVSSLGLPYLGTTVMLEGLTPQERTDALERLGAHGIGWVRQRFDWSELEPTPGTFHWEKSDALIHAITEAGLIPVVILDGSPPWARAGIDQAATDTPLAPPADPADFGRFAAAFAGRYGDQVRYYQIWDEPNIAPHWGNRHIEPVHYAQLFIEASLAIRAVDDDAMLITAALAPTVDRGHLAVDEVTFLRRLYAAGLQPHMDAVAIQPYGFSRSPTDPQRRREVLNFQRAAWVRRAMLMAGDGETPIFAARLGWNKAPATPWGSVSSQDQLRFLGEALEIGRTEWPWLSGFGWAIDQPATAADDPLWGFALDNRLLEVTSRWAVSSPPIGNSGTDGSLQWPVRTRAGLMLLAMVVILWRAWSAQDRLPWDIWGQRYRSWPVWRQLTIWVAWLALYYLAVWPPLIGLLLAGAAVLILFQPPVGVWLAALLLPFFFQHKEVQLIVGTLTITPTQAIVVAAIPAMMQRLHRLFQRPKARPWHGSVQPLDWFALIWLALSLLVGKNVWHWPGYLEGLIDLVITPLLLYAMLRSLVTGRALHIGTAVALFSGGALVAALGLVHWMLGGGTEVDTVRRLVGPYFSANHAALMLIRALFLGMGLWLAAHDTPMVDSGHRRWLALMVLPGTLVTVGLALLLTASRGALLLGLPAGLAIFLWLSLPRRRARAARFLPWYSRLIMLSVAGVCILGLAILFWPRLSNMATWDERIDLWRASLQLWQGLPIFGTGPGGFLWRFPANIPPGSTLDPNLRHPHNIWLEFGTMWGLLGFVWLLSLLGWVASHVWQERHVVRAHATGAIAIGLIAGLTAGLAHGQVDAFAGLADVAGWNWMALGLWRAFVHARSSPR